MPSEPPKLDMEISVLVADAENACEDGVTGDA